MNSKKYFTITIALLLATLLLCAAAVVFVDPYFHYHAPLSFLEYPLNNQRYQNDGISKHFDYDAIITGTSMTENFKCSELDSLFGVNSVKLSYSGGSYKEIGAGLDVALAYHPKTKLVVRCLDYYNLTKDKDYMEYDSYPEYLYDNNILNDVKYLFDKNAILDAVQVIQYSLAGNTTTDFDTYSSWVGKFDFGYDAVMSRYTRLENAASEQKEMTDYYRTIVSESIEQNVVKTVREYPDTEFYLFFPPYGIAGWDNIYRLGNMDILFECHRAAIKQLLQYDNVHVFDFLECTDIITDLDNYMDTSHYDQWVNSFILESMAGGDHEITLKNVDEYCDKIKDFYLHYDYDAVFDTVGVRPEL